MKPVTLLIVKFYSWGNLKKWFLDPELKLILNVITSGGSRNNSLIYLWVYAYNINPADLGIETTQVGY